MFEREPKSFLVFAQCATALYSLKIVAILLVNAQKPQALLFLIRTELSFFLICNSILFRLFLILFFVAETGVVPNLLLNFEQK